jgi:hypothetical protein
MLVTAAGCLSIYLMDGAGTVPLQSTREIDMPEVCELTIAELNKVSAGRNGSISMDLGFIALAMTENGSCYGYGYQFMGSHQTTTGWECPGR